MGISPSLLPLPFDTRRQNERALEKRREKGRKKKEGLIEGRSLACSIRLFLQANTAQCAVAVCHSERVSDALPHLSSLFLPLIPDHINKTEFAHEPFVLSKYS